MKKFTSYESVNLTNCSSFDTACTSSNSVIQDNIHYNIKCVNSVNEVVYSVDHRANDLDSFDHFNNMSLFWQENLKPVKYSN